MVLRKNQAATQKRKGQGMTEYIIILALVAIALITVITIFGQDIKNIFASSTTAISKGKSGAYKPKTKGHKQTKDLNLGTGKGF